MNHDLSRRTFIAAGAASLAATSLPALEPIQRKNPNPKLKLSLAAYSFRQFLPNYRGGKPKKTEMTMLNFVDYCAQQELDGAEITAYFIPDPTPHDLINRIKRRAAVNGIDISGGAVGNRFSFAPDGPKAEAQMKSIEGWLQTYAGMGAPAIRIFAGHPEKGQSEKEAIGNIIHNLNAAAKIAETYGVILAIENHDFTTHVDRLMDILEGV
ncbi:MAG: TIM barrel protein, partial [Verrucomicrobiota bacterium]